MFSKQVQIKGMHASVVCAYHSLIPNFDFTLYYTSRIRNTGVQPPKHVKVSLVYVVNVSFSNIAHIYYDTF